MADKQQWEGWLNEWEAYEKEVKKYVKNLKKYVKQLPDDGEVSTQGGPGFDRPIDPPRFP